MRPVSDLVGKRFGRLVVLREDGRDDRGRVVWVCRCDCGRETTTTTYQLTHGRKKSCGCRRSGGRGSDALYGLWYRYHYACSDPRSTSWHAYGERGVSCAWDDAESFAEWATSHGYAPGMTLARRDPKGDVCPDNCYWAAPEEGRGWRSSAKWRPVHRSSPDSPDVRYDSVTDAARDILDHCPLCHARLLASVQSSISDAARGAHATAYGYRWRYEDTD